MRTEQTGVPKQPVTVVQRSPFFRRAFFARMSAQSADNVLASWTPAPAAPPRIACWMTKRTLSGRENWERRYFLRTCTRAQHVRTQARGMRTRRANTHTQTNQATGTLTEVNHTKTVPLYARTSKQRPVVRVDAAPAAKTSPASPPARPRPPPSRRPTALAACCGFDLCHKYIWYLVFGISTSAPTAAHVATAVDAARTLAAKAPKPPAAASNAMATAPGKNMASARNANGRCAKRGTHSAVSTSVAAT